MGEGGRINRANPQLAQKSTYNLELALSVCGSFVFAIPYPGIQPAKDVGL